MKTLRKLLALLLCLTLFLSLAPTALAADKISKAKGPVITKQPEDQDVVEGKVAKFSISASGSKLKYRWQINEDGKWLDCTDYGADKASLQFKATLDRDGSSYRCIVTDSDGGSTTSDTVSVRVFQHPHIVTQPLSAEPREDEEVEFTVVATGTDLQYCWETVVGSAWKACTEDGADGPTLTLKATAENKGRKLRCVISNKVGSVTSSVVVVMVKLRDEEALENIQTLTAKKLYPEAIEYAEDYYEDIPMVERDPKLLTACVHAYALQAGNLEWAHQNEAAEALLQECCDKYAGTTAVREADLALKTLQTALKNNEPVSGAVFQGSAKGKYAEIIVQADDSPALIKLENPGNSSQYLTFYVRAGEKASVKVADGDYTLKIATGDKWYSNEELFGSGTSYAKAKETLHFESIKKGSTVEYTTQTVSLIKSSKGNLSISDIDPDKF